MNRVTSRRKRDVVDCLRAVFLLQWHNCMLLCDISSTAVGKLLCHRRCRWRECPNLKVLARSLALQCDDVSPEFSARSLLPVYSCRPPACGALSQFTSLQSRSARSLWPVVRQIFIQFDAQAKAVAVIRFLTHGYLRDDDSNTYVSSANVVKVLKWKRLKI